MFIKPKKKGWISGPAPYYKAAALPGPPVLTFVAFTPFGSHSGSVETYTGLSIGSTAGFTTRRLIFVQATGNLLCATPTISSILINGSISATVHVEQSGGASGKPYASVFSALIPTGTTANIDVTYNNALFNDMPMAVYSIDDTLLVSTTPQTGKATATGTTSITTSSFTQSANGVNVAGTGFSAAVTAPSASGYTSDSTNSGGGYFAHVSGVSSGSATFAPSWTTSADSAAVVASWR